MFQETDMDGFGNSGRLVRLKAAAARLGVSVRTLYRIIAEDGLSLVHIRGCSCLKEADLTAYIEKSKKRGNHD
jgi:excisionase family DNA binding protein